MPKKAARRPRPGTLKWFEARWNDVLAEPHAPAKLAKRLARMSLLTERLAARVHDMDGMDHEMETLLQTVRDLGIGYRTLSGRLNALAARLGVQSPEPFPELGKDGLVTVRGIPHLPECDVVTYRKKKLVMACSCGAVGEREKQNALN